MRDNYRTGSYRIVKHKTVRHLGGRAGDEYLKIIIYSIFIKILSKGEIGP